MRRILYIVSTLKRSGPTSQLFNIIKYLDRERFSPYIVTLSPEPVESLWEDYQGIRVDLCSLKLSRIQGLFLAKYKLGKLIEAIRPDLIHTQGIRADVLSSRLNLDVPRVSTVRNYPQDDYLMTYGGVQGRIMVRHHIDAFRRLDLCVGVSRAVERNINEMFMVKNTVCIPNGVNVERFFPVSEVNKYKARQRLSLPEASRIWISVGHLSSRKDPLFLIEQWKKYFGESKENVLLFLGGGELEKECKLEMPRSGNIIIKGRVNNVADYLQASDYLVSASKAEGLPNTVIEALACGLPCLLSDIAPHKEVVSMNKNIGGVFKLGDSRSFLDSLICLQKKDYSAMREAALHLVETKLSAQVMSNSYQVQYDKLMDAYR